MPENSKEKGGKGSDLRQVCVCLPPELMEKTMALGGVRWLRIAVSRADMKTDAVLKRNWRGEPRVRRQCFTLSTEAMIKFKLLGGSAWLRAAVSAADLERDGV